MDLRQLIKIECIKKNITISYLSDKLGISRQLMYHYIGKKNIKIILEIEKILSIEKGSLSKRNSNL